MSDELKPCPFCGAPAELEQCDTEGPREFRWTVGCHDDECIGYQSLTTYDRQITAVAAWNRRAAAPEPPAPGVDAPSEASGVSEGELIGDVPAMVEAWLAVFELVSELDPEWRTRDASTGKESVLAAIRKALTAPPAITADALVRALRLDPSVLDTGPGFYFSVALKVCDLERAAASLSGALPSPPAVPEGE